MRTLLLFLLSACVFIGAYLIVAWVMPDPDGPPQRTTQVVPTAPREADQLIGDVDGVTLRSHDPRTGAPIGEVRIGEYRRSGEHQVLLNEIEATILMERGGGVVTLSAPTGTIDLEGEAQQEDRLTPETLGTADVARLRNVVVRWYDAPADVARGPEGALLTLRVDNLVYDNKRFSLFTSDTEIGGSTVLADDVPVEVRGRDYDFDGFGLLVRWDAQTRRPTYFRVARGRRLTIKTDKAFLPTSIVDAGERDAGPLLASLDAAAVAEALQEQQADAQLQPYRATLVDHIRVVQEGQTRLEADTAEFLFALTPPGGARQESAPAEPATRPTQPAGPKAPEAPFQPVTVFWEGELLVEAQPTAEASADAPKLASAEDVRVHLVGNPLVMRQEGVEVRAVDLNYAGAADELVLTGRDDLPVTLVDAEGNTLVTTRMVAHPEAGIATATAAGYADVKSGENGSMQLRWQEACDFAFAATPPAPGEPEDEERSKQHLESIAARGAVAVRHPDIRLDADSLEARLSAPDAGGDQSLRAVVAAGRVRAEFAASTAPAQEGDPAAAPAETTTFTSDRLTLEMPDGEQGPITALAEGHVQSIQEGQRLTAERLQATLSPDDTGELALVELLASGNVEGVDDEGRILNADALLALPLPRAEGARRQPVRVRLEGAPGKVAFVQMNDDQLAAPVLEFNTADETVVVPGIGELHTIQTGGEGQEVPVIVSWAGSMSADQREVILEQDVQLIAREEGIAQPVSTQIDFRADAANLLIAPPENAPEQPAQGGAQQDPAPANGAQEARDDPADLAGDIEQVQLRGNIRGTLEEWAAERMVRSFDIRTEALDAEPLDESVRLDIPAPGRVLFRDLRAVPDDDDAPRAAEDGDPDAPVTADAFRGNAAVEWQEALSFEPATGMLELSGRVLVAVEPMEATEPGGYPERRGRAFRLESDRLNVQTASVMGRTEMRMATAAGNARFTAQGVSFIGAEIRYDPTTRRITARGTGNIPVVVYDADGVPTGRFGELVFNLATGQLEQLRDVGAGG